MRSITAFAVPIVLVALAGCAEVKPREACPADLTECGETCINPVSDNLNCGGCGIACGAGEVCSAGECALSCQDGLVECGGRCIDPRTDRAFCGASGDCTGASAGAACEDGFVCDGMGACALSCQVGLVECGGRCVDPDTDRGFCGASADCTGASAGAACEDGFVCDGMGTCALSCQAGLEDCSGTCTDTSFDPGNCGGCGNTCGSTQVCVDSGCTTILAVEFSENFVMSADDPAHCTRWDEFKADLAGGGFSRVTFSGSRDPAGISCSDPAAVAQLANGLTNETNVFLMCNGASWQVCNRGNHLEFWVGAPSQCDPANCPSVGRLTRPCNTFNLGFWGGINNGSGSCAGPSQSMTVRFE